MKINMNDTVKVKLTKQGKKILREHFEEMHKLYPSVFKKFTLPVEDENGYSEWQLHYLMNTFGEHTTVGQLPPFELDIIINKVA